MNRSLKLMVYSSTLFVAVACIGLQQYASQVSTVVPDQVASVLFGGACENGHKFKLDGHCGQFDDDKPYKGCKWKTNYKDDGAGGSYLGDGTDNCGVSECGTYNKTKACS